ncbi:MAG: glucose-1-phosphate thymidylyltransferase [Planctomycetota bacterium]|nr:MAG: glucose-1-phosphate thymidylyltransferase [Planctomycetota bacterium]
MSIALFEDDLVCRLDPAAVGRPAFAITCGGYRLIDVVLALGQPVSAHVRPHLQSVVAADYADLQHEHAPKGQAALWLNARVVPSAAALDTLRRLLAGQRPGIVRSGDAVALALMPHDSRVDTTGANQSIAEQLAALNLPTLEWELPLFEYAHDIIRHHMAILCDNLEHRVACGDYEQRADGVFTGPDTKLGEYVVTDTSRGPIVLEAGATIGPYCYLSGPVYVGARARVLEYAALKDGVSIGHTTKIGGEVDASIVEPYTNKQHHGFLGHSYLGSWVNLGAGTCNSDLKNTYGLVNMEYRGEKVPTGMQFVGAIVGDYAKTAINTGIFTGKTVGVCSMVYGFVTTNVPSFVNYARLFGQVTEVPVEIMVSTQRRMFERRGVAQRECDIQLLLDMYALTDHERKQPGQTLSLEPLSL